MTPADLVVTPRGCRFMGRTFPCVVGRGGITQAKTEGDGATPLGSHKIVAGTYRADRLAHPFGGRRGPIAMRPVGHGDIWSDDPADPAYNHGLWAPDHRFGHERLRRGDPVYDLLLITDWNWPDAQPGRGSAIFIHSWRKPGHPTEGCVAFSRRDLLWIVKQLSRRSRLIVKPR